MNRKKSLYTEILLLTIFPILLLGLAITILSVYKFSTSYKAQVQKQLKNIALVVLDTYDRMYPGDFAVVDKDGELEIYKGDKNISEEYLYLDSIKQNTGIDITIFYYNTRVLTTVFEDNKRIVGTTLNTHVKDEVLDKSQENFYTSVYVSKEQFFAYYKPIYDSNGKTIGMIFAGRPIDEFNREIYYNIIPPIIITFISISVVALLFLYFTKRIVKVITNIEEFMSDISNGELYSELHQSILDREDEIGIIGQSAVQMQKSLKVFVDQDALTKINNRRCGQKLLDKTFLDAKERNRPFALAIGDIDWFKRVNDNFGHECGDFVLQRIAYIIKNNIEGKGYVARWGGEEFLIVFEDLPFDQAYQLLNNIANKIRHNKIHYENHKLSITMTFGIVEGDPDIEVYDLLKEADKKLYFGKHEGRNRIIK